MLRSFSTDNIVSVVFGGRLITTPLRAYILPITQPSKQKLALQMLNNHPQ